MRLKRNENCPIHNRRNCCGRERHAFQKRKYLSLEPGVSQIPDETVPRGYRERRSKSAMKRLLVEKVRDQHGLCALCHKEFMDFSEVTPDHIEPRGMGAARLDDHPSNIQAAHGWCNSEKGSKRI